jgi:hypothetical protein
MTIVSIDDTDYGTDIAGSTIVGPIFGVASGLVNLANAWVRRLSTARGALSPEDDGYGLDLRMWIGRRNTPTSRDALRAMIKAQLEQDPRASHVDVVVSFSGSTMGIEISGETVAGEAFDMVVGVTALTVELLNLNGQPVAAAIATVTSTQVVYVQGPPGPPGPPGTGGGGGGGGAGANLIDETETKADSSGNEVIVDQAIFDFGLLGAAVTAELLCLVGSASGTATARLRIGGTAGNADGALAAFVTVSVIGPLKLSNTGTLSNPAGLQLVTVTLQSSSAGNDATIYGRSVSLR